MTGIPKEIFGTKWPSITSIWSQSAPPFSTRFSSSARREKSAESMEGEMSMVVGSSFL